MATDLGLDTAADGLGNITSSSNGFADRVKTFLRNAFHSSVNAFGDVATRNTGTANGNVPVLDGDGKFASSLIPTASQTTTGAVELATDAEVTARAANRAVQARQIQLLAASDTRYGLARRATTAEVNAKSNVNAYMTPSDFSTADSALDATNRNVTANSSTTEDTVDIGLTITDYRFITIGYYTTNNLPVSISMAVEHFGSDWIVMAMFNDEFTRPLVVWVRRSGASTVQFRVTFPFTSSLGPVPQFTLSNTRVDFLLEE